MRCGTDIVNVARVRETIEKLGDAFKKRVYTDEEINYCESRRMCKYESYAARFAAKEAEILSEESGRPYVVLHGELKKIIDSKRIEVSLSHEREFAIAFAIVT